MQVGTYMAHLGQQDSNKDVHSNATCLCGCVCVARTCTRDPFGCLRVLFVAGGRGGGRGGRNRIHIRRRIAKIDVGQCVECITMSQALPHDTCLVRTHAHTHTRIHAPHPPPPHTHTFDPGRRRAQPLQQLVPLPPQTSPLLLGRKGASLPSTLCGVCVCGCVLWC